MSNGGGREGKRERAGSHHTNREPMETAFSSGEILRETCVSFAHVVSSVLATVRIYT